MVWLSQTLKATPFVGFSSYPCFLFSNAPSPINRVPYSLYFTCWIWIEKLLCTNCVRCFWGLFPLGIRSHLEWLESSQVVAISLILEEDHTPSGVTNSLPSHKLFIPSSFFSIFSITPCIFVFLCYCFSSIVNLVSNMLLCFLPCSFNFRPSSSITIYLYFSFAL